jgi:hypothetical protein
VAKAKRKLYFDNKAVEELLDKYVDRGCVDVYLRDQIMVHAEELIRQIIRVNNFEYIYPGRDQASFGELCQVAWMQIEKTLYKYNNAPGSPKVFNMWSQIAKTRILAFLKNEKRDKKNMPSYKEFVIRRHKTKARSVEEFEEFIEELKVLCEYDPDLYDIACAMEKLWSKDDKPYDGLKVKLIEISGKDVHTVTAFLKLVKLHRDEFSVNTIETRDFDGDNNNYFYNDHDE